MARHTPEKMLYVVYEKMFSIPETEGNSAPIPCIVFSLKET